VVVPGRAEGCIAAYMVCVDRIPISIVHPSAIPVRVSDANRPTLKVAGVVTYDIMVEEEITLVELQSMGCNLTQVFYCWGERPAAANLDFRGMSKKCLNIVKCLLQNQVMRRHFHGVRWFAAGLSIKDMMHMQPSVETLKVFNVTTDELQANNAHDFGENWQSMFEWTAREWTDLGFDRRAYAAGLQLQRNALGGIAHDKLVIQSRWGPLDAAGAGH